MLSLVSRGLLSISTVNCAFSICDLLFWQDRGLSHGLGRCKDLPDIPVACRVGGKHSKPGHIPGKGITSVPSSL